MDGQQSAEGEKSRRGDPRPETREPDPRPQPRVPKETPRCELRDSSDPVKEAAGSRHEPGVARQTAPADVEPYRDDRPLLTEPVGI